MRVKLGLISMMAAAALVGAALIGANWALAQAPAAPPAAPPASTPAPAVSSGGGEAAGCRIGFVDLTRVLEESAEGKALKTKLDAEGETLLKPLKDRQKELEGLQAQINQLMLDIIKQSSMMDPETYLIKQYDLQNLQLRYQHLDKTRVILHEKAQRDMAKKKSEMLKPLEEKLNKIMAEIGKQGNFCVVFDVSQPNMAPVFNPIIFRNPALDITAQIIAEVDKK